MAVTPLTASPGEPGDAAARGGAQRPPRAMAAGVGAMPTALARGDLGAAGRRRSPATEVDGCAACGGPSGPTALDLEDEGRFLVCRAVQRLLTGTLNESTETAFAQTLGVSGRHLRRLFLKHVGVTPAAMAAAARARAARRLLAMSDLKISDVAFGVGFGSVRQFNRVMVETYGLTPRELRGRPGGGPLAGGGALVLRLRLPRRYDWDRTLELVRCSGAPGVEQVTQSMYRRVVETVRDDVGVLEAHRPEGADHLLVAVHLPSWSRILHVVDRVRSALGLSPSAPAAGAGRPGAWGGPQRRTDAAGAGPLVQWTAYEAAVKAIVGVPDDDGALERMARLVEALGRPLPGGAFGHLRRFPTANDLSRAAVHRVGLPPHVAAPLVEVAAAVAEAALPIADGLPATVRFRSLRSISGVTDGMVERFIWLTGGVAPSAGAVSDPVPQPSPIAR